MRTFLSAGLLMSGLAALSGCGGSGSAADPNMVLVAGNISVNDQPAGNALVSYLPAGDTKGNGGSGMSDSTGRYEILTPQGKNSLPPGKYKVTVSRPLNRDGSPPDPSVPPIESTARETLPPKYCDPLKTELSVTLVAGDKRSFDYSLKTAKK